MGSEKTVAVIGAGMVGILAIKSLQEESFECVCFESRGYFGGLWHYHEDDAEDVASVMKTTVINTSKELGAVSDFPPPAECPNYMRHEMMYKYISMIAQKIGAERCIKFYHQVESISPADDYQETGRWVVAVRDTRNNIKTRTTFDGVMVCTGHHSCPNMPSFPGMEEFQGKIMHTHCLKRVNGFEDQRVVVIGVGNSGLDAAAEISNVAKQVYVSSRRGTWVVPRMWQYGNPYDAAMHRRSKRFVRRCLPFNVLCSMTEKQVNKKLNHFMYNLNPKHRILSQHPAVSDVFPFKLLCGTVIMRRIVKKFTKTGVVFEGENELTEVDAVICATGYKIKFPFLSDDILKVEDNKVRLYKYVYPPHLPHPTLAIIGLIQPSWSSMVMNGKCSLPSQNEMLPDILKKESILRKTFVQSPQHTLQVDFIDYQDELASLIGVKPNFWKLAFTDPKLFQACITGPCLPYQYRLQGPHAWNGARNAILTYKDRVTAAFLKPDGQQTDKKLKHSTTGFNACGMVFLLLLLLWYLSSVLTGNSSNILNQ